MIMSEYDYGNARLKAMKSRLLSRREVEALADSGTHQALTSALVRTAYRAQLQIALTRAASTAGGAGEALELALHADLVETMGRVRSFFSGEAAGLVALALQAYDVHNLKAILRGLGSHAASGDITRTLLPVGELSASLLAEITRAPGQRPAIDRLASMNLSIAQPLVRLRSARPGADTFELELALEQWRFQQASQKLTGEDEDERLLQSVLLLDADITNLLTVLRFIHAPVERKLLRQRLGSDQLQALFVGPGRLSFAALLRIAEQSTLPAALDQLASTPYEPALRLGLEAYTRSHRLSEFEKMLAHHRLTWLARGIAKDPLGLGVFLGYLALKVNEVLNLHWITNGISLGLTPAALRAELSFAGEMEVV
jgi:V/A-type H+-transporting ATPase subunit C